MPRATNRRQAAVSAGVCTPRCRIGLLFALAVCAFVSLASLAASPAAAVTDSEQFTQFGSHGSGAGQFASFIRSMASDPLTGHLFAKDNTRIDEFTAWGDFVKAWGWGVADGEEELETCTEETGCMQGLPGAGNGQFGLGGVGQVAVDGNGNVYVAESKNHRVQGFDSTGQFVLMFGAEVNKTTGGNVCTAASGDECQAGTAGSGPGEFSEKDTALAIGQTGTVLLGGDGRIQEFELDGSFKGEFKVSGNVTAIAPDPSGSDLYVTLDKEGTFKQEDDVHKLSSSGAELGSLKVREPQAIAIDAAGNLYAVQAATPNEIVGGVQILAMPPVVIEFNPSGSEVSRCCIPENENYSLTGLATNTAGDLYVASIVPGSPLDHITAYGPGPVKFGPPPKVPPAILAQYPVSVDSTSATLKAQINPEFWADTRFYLEYGPEPCAGAPCTQFPAAPGQELGAGGVRKAVTGSGVVLTGLAPHTTYHYRFVAESGGGGPVFGPDRTFTTFPASHPPDPCPANQAFRTGPAANLPDCRAYEMVSPVDKNNGDIMNLSDVTGFETRLDQAATDGEALTYSSYRAFGGAEGGPYTSQYLARRGSAGWQSEALGGPLVGNFYGSSLLEDEFKAFSPELCHSWLVPGGESDLAPGRIPGYPNLYRRDNCPTGYEALTTVQPPTLVPKDYIPELQGFSADGTKAVFRVDDKLTEDAKGFPEYQVYEAGGGALKLVCVFPPNISVKAEAEFPNCSAGTSGGSDTAINRTANVAHAMSEDGSRIYWSAASGKPQTPGKIYLRLNGTTTLPVSETQTTKPARFWGASPDGSRALYEVEDPDQKNPSVKDKNLYLYDLGSKSSALVAGKARGVAATSEDLSRIYFVAEEVLAGTSGASAGKANLYLDEEGTMTFVATLAGKDIGALPSDASWEPIYQAARATPDGSRIAFISTEPLTGFDNTDLESGGADSEVFSYDAVSGELNCVSCSPAGARPAGRNVLARGTSGQLLWTAASLPLPQTQLNAPRALSTDGKSLFFTSYADLLPADTNGKADVYEWEALGSGSCEGESDPDYYPANGGCLFLISSGESPSDSRLIDTGAGGRDVFFTTNASLLPQDPGLIDIYDARAGGGFPPPQGPPAPCEGEACQSSNPPPNDPTPASAGFKGAGNLKAGPPARCAKGKARRKGRCVAKKQRKGAKRAHHRAANNNRRTAR